MGADHDWPGLLADFRTALDAFERATAAITAALVERTRSPSELQSLIADEASAREAVTIARNRLMEVWRRYSGDSSN